MIKVKKEIMKFRPLESYQEYFKGNNLYRFPSRVILELTNLCNLSCSMCPRRYVHTEEGFLDYKLFTKIIDEISMYSNVAIIPFFRGESLLHPDFIPMLRYIKTQKIAPVQLATNGLLFDEKMSRAILDLDIDSISFSIKELDDEEVARNIEIFLKKKKAKSSKLPVVQVSVVETGQTKDSLDAFVSKWIGKVDRVRVYQEHSFGGQFGCLKNEEMPHLAEQRKPCLKLLTEIAIYWNGNIAICNHDWDNRQSLGNANKDSIKDIWNSKDYRQLRKMHFENQFVNDIVCKKCDHWKTYYTAEGMIGKLYTKNS